MCDIDEGDAESLMHFLQFQLHLFAHLEVQCTERLVQKKDFRLIHDSAGDGDSLLLSAGKSGDGPLLKAFQVDELQNLFHLLLNDILRHLLLPETECDIFINIHMREKRISLKDRVDRPFVGRKIGNIFAVQKNFALRRQFESGYHSEGRRLAAAGRSQKGNEFTALDIQIEVRDGGEAVIVCFCDVLQLNNLFSHFYRTLFP